MTLHSRRGKGPHAYAIHDDNEVRASRNTAGEYVCSLNTYFNPAELTFVDPLLIKM